MKKFIAIIASALALTLGSAAHAETSDIAWSKAPINTRDNGSLQRGAALFVNYCLNCHSAAFMRWNRLQDIGLTEKQIKDYFLNVDADEKGKVYGETMQSAIDPVQAKAWFGANPPDLSVIARSRAGSGGSGADYLYTYMTSFYPDDSRPTGWNNLLFPNVGMPHVLWELQGQRTPIMTQHPKTGEAVWTGKWQAGKAGTLTEAEYNRAAGDLANYLQWMAEPAQNQRKTIGVFALLFLALLSFITWNLNRAFWREVK